MQWPSLFAPLVTPLPLTDQIKNKPSFSMCRCILCDRLCAGAFHVPLDSMCLCVLCAGAFHVPLYSMCWCILWTGIFYMRWCNRNCQSHAANSHIITELNAEDVINRRRTFNYNSSELYDAHYRHFP